MTTDVEMLISRYLLGALSPEQASALDAWVAASDANANAFVAEVFVYHLSRDVVVDADRAKLLDAFASQDSEPEPLSLDALASLESSSKADDLVHLTEHDVRSKSRSNPGRDSGVLFNLGAIQVYRRRGSQSHGRQARPVARLAWAALLVLGIWAWYAMRAEQPSSPPRESALHQHTTTPPPAVAAITRTFDAKWDQTAAPLREGFPLHLGGSFHLTEGLIEVSFDNGATLVLEAPCRLEVKSETAVGLSHGKLTARIPPAAHGFRVHTPHAEVIDLGTEFGVAVAEDGAVEAAVFLGKVRLRSTTPGPPSAKLVEVGGGFAAHVDAKGVIAPDLRPIDDLATTFRVHMPRNRYEAAVMRARPIVYWCFEPQLNGTIPNAMSSRYAGQLVGDVQLVEDRFGQAMKLSSTEGYLKLSPAIAELRGTPTYSFVCLVKVHRRMHHPMTILSILSDDRPQAEPPSACLLELRGFNDASEHPNRVRFLHRTPPAPLGGVDLFSPQPFPEGEWFHLAAVKETDRLLLYINGQRMGEEHEATAMAHELAVMFVGAHAHSGENVDRAFSGFIDELAIYDRALSEQELQRAYDTFTQIVSLQENR